MANSYRWTKTGMAIVDTSRTIADDLYIKSQHFMTAQMTYQEQFSELTKVQNEKLDLFIEMRQLTKELDFAVNGTCTGQSIRTLIDMIKQEHGIIGGRRASDLVS